MNIPAPLYPLFEQGLLDEVLRPLMSGKEASVYLVRSRGMLCVAKIYKDAQHRSFRQRSAYAEGRQVRNSRERRAMQKGTGFGKSLLEAEWQNSEVQALYRLYDAGVRVPIPYHHAENVLLMELVADANGDPAPRLYDMHLTAEDARLLHQILIADIVRMLCAGLVHGDLSEYNILIAADGPVIIDLPQATDAANNRNSERLFLRDVENLANFLGRAAPELKKTRYGPEIWDLFSRAELEPEAQLTGRFSDKKKKIDTSSVIAEIRASAEEFEKTRPPSAYQLKKQKQAEAARAAAEEAARNPPPPRRDAGDKRRDGRGPESDRSRDGRPRGKQNDRARDGGASPRGRSDGRPRGQQNDRARDGGASPRGRSDNRPRGQQNDRARDGGASPRGRSDGRPRGQQSDRARDERPRDDRARDDGRRAQGRDAPRSDAPATEPRAKNEGAPKKKKSRRRRGRNRNAGGANASSASHDSSPFER